MHTPTDVLMTNELDDEAKKVDLVSHEVLGANYMTISVNHLELEEDCVAMRSRLQAYIIVRKADQSHEIKALGEGVGLVDAAFDSMMKAFGPEHISLNGISIDDFGISTKFRTTFGRKSDADAIALLRMRNSENYEFAFTCRTPSISQSSLGVVTQAFAFFVNSERAFVQLHLGMEDAKLRNRQDLVERFQRQMSVLVHATSYKKVVEKLSEKSKGVAS